MAFSFDTSAFLDAWTRYYPPDVFPTIWDKLNEAAAQQEVLCIEEVLRDLAKKDDGIHGWVKARPQCVVAIDDDIQRCLVEIMGKHQRLVDSRKSRSGSDPWVIALAKARGLTVVTAEKSSGNLTKPKIPDVCRDFGISCLEVVDFFRKVGWRL